MLRIDTSARLHIEQLISEGRYRNPVASLFDEGPPIFAEGEVARVVRRAMSGSQADATRARDLLAKSVSLDQVDWRLQVRVDEREECVGADFVLLDGLTFAMSHDIQRALEHYSLVRQNQCLLLIGPDDVAKSLMSVKTISLGSDPNDPT